MKIISSPLCLLHETGPLHPESRARFLAVDQALRESGFLTDKTALQPHQADLEDLLLCHDESYINRVIQEVSSLEEGEIKTLSTGDVEISYGSLEAALCAQGAVITAAVAILDGVTKHAFVNVRPPGHHVTRDRGMGFCLFNNVATGARCILKRNTIKRVLIVDFDVHHGNGTQDIFYEDPSVFYFSIHQEGIYPGTGFHWETGSADGIGTTLNRPLNPGPNVLIQLEKAFQDLEEAMEKFKPEFVLISAGFDAHELDPIGGLKFKTETFHWMTKKTISIANRYADGRVLSVLEGGYSLRGLYLSTIAHLQAF